MSERKNAIQERSWGQFLICNFCPFAVSSHSFAKNWCKKDGQRRTAQMDRAISIDFAEQKTYEKSIPGFDFSYVFRSAKLILLNETLMITLNLNYRQK